MTVKTGYSLAELVLSPEPIEDASGTRPDALLVLSPEGRKRATGYLAAMGESGNVFKLPEIEVPEGTSAEVLDPALSSERIGKDALAIALATATVARLGLLPRRGPRRRRGGGGRIDARRGSRGHRAGRIALPIERNLTRRTGAVIG